MPFEQIILFTSLLHVAYGHGHITWPPSRHNGSLAEAGRCDRGECMWFSQPTSIPGAPTLPHEMRSYNTGTRTGESNDWSATMPWRAPGTASVQGSGCGVMGGNKVPLPNGGEFHLPGIPQGMDGILLPKLHEPVLWERGSVQEVAFGITANHGGGYSWRLCPADGEVTEECFQQHVLRFAGDTQYIQHDNQTFQYNKMVKLPRFPMPLHKTTRGTHPAGSEWARVPIPGCRLCDQSTCGKGLMPNLTETFEIPPAFNGGHGPSERHYGGLKWFEQQSCAQSCSGLNITACPPGMVQFPEPLNGISGFTMTEPPVGRVGFPYSVVDNVKVPDTYASGDYLLSWRWDCEQSHQIWQNCADVRITDAA